MLRLSCSAVDLGCVKTVTRKKCRKYSSPPRASSSRAQHDSAVMTDNCPVIMIFYTRNVCRSFHTAKTHNGHRLSRNLALHNSRLVVALRYAANLSMAVTDGTRGLPRLP